MVHILLNISLKRVLSVLDYVRTHHPEEKVCYIELEEKPNSLSYPKDLRLIRANRSLMQFSHSSESDSIDWEGCTVYLDTTFLSDRNGLPVITMQNLIKKMKIHKGDAIVYLRSMGMSLEIYDEMNQLLSNHLPPSERYSKDILGYDSVHIYRVPSRRER